MHSDHTKSSDKGKINNKADILTEKRSQQKKNLVETPHKKEGGKNRRKSAKDKMVEQLGEQYFYGLKSA